MFRFPGGAFSHRRFAIPHAASYSLPIRRRPPRNQEAAIRYAIYYAPAPDDPLTLAAAAWLGRDAFGRGPGPGPSVPGFSPEEVETRTVDARRYGFHATLKAPFRLAEGRSAAELAEALARFAQETAPATLAGLALADLDGFFALVPAEPSPALDALAARIVEGFEPFRAPLTSEEMAKRRPERLSPRRRLYLERFGYPLVLEEFEFHMTLTDRLPPEERAKMRAALEQVFSPALLGPRAVDRLALFREDRPGAPFAAEAMFPLGGAA